ncbi:MAG: dTDP-glucose 4,6-dehydratase [Planctomycetota bacterium]
MKRLLVTGGAGFIGSNFVRWILEQRSGWEIINLDRLTYSGNLDNLRDVETDKRYKFVKGDICDLNLVQDLVDQCDVVVHFAAESHVDRSINDTTPFVQTNINGTKVLLDAIQQTNGTRMVHVSTDEVYGSLPLDQPDVRFTEETPLAPNSPYAASKAAADLLVRAYHRTYGLDVVTTRCSNNFGPYQFPEKVIPRFVTRLLQGENVPLYGDGRNVRDWIHVQDHCEAILAVLEGGVSGSVYNIGGNNERSNLELTRMILDSLGLGEDRIQHVPDRLGHDKRYAVSSHKMLEEFGWRPTRSCWPTALQATIQWYVDHREWWERIETGDYQAADPNKINSLGQEFVN